MKNNRPKQSRTQKKETKRNRFEKIYYIIITILILILVGLLTYIFFIRDSGTDQISEDITPTTELPTNTDEENEENDSENTEENNTQTESENSELTNQEDQETEDASDPNNESASDNESSETDENADEEETTDSSEQSSNEAENTQSNETEEANTENTESVESEDPLVEDAYTADWPAVGTEQSGEHTTDFSDGSQDRTEINQAVRSVTGLQAGNMIEWWIGGSGSDEVTATVSDSNQSQVYRVSLQFIEGEGWKPTLVEELSQVPDEYQ